MVDTYTVIDLCNEIEAAISGAFSTEIWVKGVISSLKRSRNGHVYFDLIEEDPTSGEAPKAVLPVTLFKGRKGSINRTLKEAGGGTPMADGIKIRIRGEVGFYSKMARAQLNMTGIDPEYTLGQMEVDRKRLLEMLEAKGLLRRNAQLKIPATPLNVGLITSRGSAAHKDFISELTASGYRFKVTVIDARMQGAESVSAIKKAITYADTNRTLDVLVIARGGGARSDLVAFDHGDLVNAICFSAHPIITGIGHEIDTSVADEVAHTRTKTPTAAAGFLVGKVTKAEADVANLWGRLALVSNSAVQLSKSNLQRISGSVAQLARRRLELESQAIAARTSLLAVSARHGLGAASVEVQSLERNLFKTAEIALGRNREKLDLASKRVRALDPQLTLQRGYSITRSANGKVISDTDEVDVGDRLITTVAEGFISSVVAGQ